MELKTAASALSYTATPKFDPNDASHPANIFHNLLAEYVRKELNAMNILNPGEEALRTARVIEQDTLRKLGVKLLEGFEYLKLRNDPVTPENKTSIIPTW